MRHILLVALILLVGYSVDAAKQTFCSYKNLQDETILLTYMTIGKRGEEYVDFGPDGKCVRRATCNDRFMTVVEGCSEYHVTCANKRRFNGVFPACCVKC